MLNSESDGYDSMPPLISPDTDDSFDVPDGTPVKVYDSRHSHVHTIEFLTADSISSLLRKWEDSTMTTDDDDGDDVNQQDSCAEEPETLMCPEKTVSEPSSPRLSLRTGNKLNLCVSIILLQF